MYEKIPEELKEKAQWVNVWNSSKVPMQTGQKKAASSMLFYPQLGVKLCSMAGGGVQKIYMVFLRKSSRRDRSGSDLFTSGMGLRLK